jgi:hypothetical protein
MVTWILLIPSLIGFLVVFLTYRSQAKYKNGTLFAVRLPEHAASDSRIRAVQDDFARRFNWTGFWLAAAILPMVALHKHFAFQMLYFIVWQTAVFLVLTVPFRRAFRETLQLKRRHGWFVSAPSDASAAGAGSGRPEDPDGDEYWANGFTYHNPRDRRVFVPKRFGIGETVNTGTKAGKLIIGGALGLTAVVLIGAMVMLFVSEYTSPVLAVAPEGAVAIDYPMYKERFHVADIEELVLVDDVPRGKRVNGEATEDYARGNFRLDGLGKARLYIFRDTPPYIRIKLADRYIFYNEKDPDRTRQLYEQLRSSRDARSGS